ncbi:MAG: lipopolysaccharide kinase InaA family protein, partial [Planctomycetota bacterium]
EFARQGFTLDGREALAASGLAGREPLGALQLGEQTCVVRRFRHGGLRRALGRELFFDPARPVVELLLASRFGALGLPTPRVLAARAGRAGPGWHLALVSARAAGEDAGRVLERWRCGELPRAARRSLCRAAGELVARLHRAGFLHADLHPRNLLVAHDGTLAALDLDRGSFLPALAERTRQDNLRRLYRSVRRREARGRTFLARGDYLAFLRSYARLAGTDWRVDWRAIVRRDRLFGPLHRLGWRLEGLFGDGPERRDGG